MEKPRRASPPEVVVFSISAFLALGINLCKATHRILSRIPCFLITIELTHVLETRFMADNIATNIKM